VPSILISSVTVSYPASGTTIFRDLSLTIDTAWKTGVIGKNGSGKTTLFKLIAGCLLPMKGEVVFKGEGFYFPYRPRNPSEKTLDVVKESIAPFSAWEREMETLLAAGDEESIARYGEILADYERMDGYRIDEQLEREFVRMGLEPALLERRFDSLSGGEQTRALICALFLKRGAFPLIDEPTNHLDMAGREVLGEYLAGKSGFIIASHDRYFLDLCVDHILSVAEGQVTIRKGNYSQWEKNEELKELFERRQQERLRQEIAELKRAARKRRVWGERKERQKVGGVDKGFIGHRAAKLMRQALSIEQRINEKIEEKKGLLKNTEKERRLKMLAESRLPETLLSVSNVSIRLGDRAVVEDFSLSVSRGERVALLGPNGSGKTTLLRAIAGEVEIAHGEIHLPKHLSVAWAYQEPLWKSGHLRDLLLEEGLDETEFRTVMALLGVKGEIFERRLETFSEGELKKVDLCRSFTGGAALFIWDEPLNYLDIVTREQIERLILEATPTILFVEHDRYFIDRIATRLIRLDPPRAAERSG